MKKLTSLLLTLLFFSGFSQLRKDTTFYNRNWDETSKELASYYGLKERVKTADTLYWIARDYYIANDQLQNIGYLSELSYGDRIGYWVWYHINGELEMEGAYEESIQVGEWKFYCLLYTSDAADD